MSGPDGIPLDIKGRFQHYHVGPMIYLPNDGRGQGGTGGFPLFIYRMTGGGKGLESSVAGF